jgi:hypothetical protein
MPEVMIREVHPEHNELPLLACYAFLKAVGLREARSSISCVMF